MIVPSGNGSLFSRYASIVTSDHWQAILGPILILVVLFAKRGIFGLLAGRSEEIAHG